MVTMKMIMAKMKTMLLRTIHRQTDVHVRSYDHFLHDSKTMDSLTKTKTQVAMKRGNYWHGNTAPISSQICCSEQRGDPSWAWSIIMDSIVLALEPWPSCSVSITDPSCDLGKQVKVTVNKWSSIKSLKLVWTSETTLNLLSCKVWKI